MSSAAQNTGPATTVGPTGCSANRNEPTMPKFPPPPRRAQNRSGCSLADASTISPSAVTTSACTRLSTLSPCLRMSQPMPPPKQRPPTPVWLTMPPVVARPCACVSWSTSPHRAPPWTKAMPSTGSTETARHRRQVDDDPAVAHRGAGHIVTSAANGDLEIAVAGEAHRCGHIGGATAAGDQPGPSVDGAVPYGSGVVVLGLVGDDHIAAEPRNLHRGWCCHRSSSRGWAHHNSEEHREEVSDLDFEVRNLDFTTAERRGTLHP